ncbi:MAG: hypothetical protein NT167_25335, partial [Verrucomicrobia bacterium]|nr:hypothetical protein [Verrucomicrobiota bacterium]
MNNKETKTQRLKDTEDTEVWLAQEPSPSRCIQISLRFLLPARSLFLRCFVVHFLTAEFRITRA